MPTAPVNYTEKKYNIESSTARAFLLLVGNAIGGTELPDDFAIEDAKELFVFSKAHDMAHIIGYAIKSNNIFIEEDIMAKFQRQYYQAIQRVVILEEEIRKIRQVFETNGIDFILLKGGVIRKLYPEEWYRVSADMDFLVRTEDLHQAERLLVDNLSYKVTEEGEHHNHVTAPNGFHVDLHFILSERKGKSKEILDSVWMNCQLAPGMSHEYVMNEEFFYFYHIFHMSVHFLLGGCGIRAILDTWLINSKAIVNNRQRCVELLKKGGRYKFAGAMEKIADKWFSQSDVKSFDEMEEYILYGGVYGISQRKIAVQGDKGTRTDYIISRLFPGRSSMKHAYPIVKKYPVFLPLCWGHRLVKALFVGKTQKAKEELRYTKENESRAIEISELMKKVGLKE